MKGILLAAAVFATAWGIAGASAAETVLVNAGGDYLALPVPKDFCALAPNREADAPLLRQAQRLRSGVDARRLLLLALPCRDMPEARRGNLEAFPWFMWVSMSRVDDPQRAPPAATRKRVLDGFQARMAGEDGRRLEADMRRQMAADGLKGNLRATFMIDRDEAATYSTILADATDGRQTERSLTVKGTTFLRARFLTADFYAPHHGAPPQEAMLAAMKATMGEAVRINDAMSAATLPHRPASQPLAARAVAAPAPPAPPPAPAVVATVEPAPSARWATAAAYAVAALLCFVAAGVWWRRL